jgi:hypothetical protein
MSGAFTVFGGNSCARRGKAIGLGSPDGQVIQTGDAISLNKGQAERPAFLFPVEPAASSGPDPAAERRQSPNLSSPPQDRRQNPSRTAYKSWGALYARRVQCEWVARAAHYFNVDIPAGECLL